MTDLEMTKLCAEAMGLKVIEAFGMPHIKHDHWPSRDTSCEKTGVGLKAYSPLNDDVQAMALVKKFKLWLTFARGEWVAHHAHQSDVEATNINLNRAIVECAARMQKEKASG